MLPALSLTCRRIVFTALILSIAVSLPGCSRITYHFADWIIVNTIDNYLDLNAEQKRWTKSRVVFHLKRAEQEEYPLYIELLGSLKTALLSDFSQQQLDNFSERYQHQLQNSLKQLAPDMASLLAGLSPKQVNHLEKKLLSDNQDSYKHIDYKPEKRQSVREKDFISKFRYWFGKLSKEQQQLIKQGYRDIPDNDHRWQAIGERHIKRFTNMLRQSSNRTLIENNLSILSKDPTADFDPHEKTLYEQQRLAVRDIILKVLTTLSEKQRRKATNRLDRYINLLSVLGSEK